MIQTRHTSAFLALVTFLLLSTGCTTSAPETAEANHVAPTPRVTATAAVPAGSAARPTRFPADRYADLEIVTLLPRDAIPAIDDPRFLTAAEAGEYYDPDELVIGVVFGEEARAYSVPFLSRHEIVNDEAGGVKFAVTW
jgi:hypothetical protein